MRLIEFQKDPNLIQEARELMTRPIFGEMIKTLEDEAIHNQHLIFGVAPDDKIMHLGKIFGYNLALNNLRSMTEPIVPPVPIEATFEQPEDQPKEQE